MIDLHETSSGGIDPLLGVGGWEEASGEGVDVGDGLGGMVWGVGIHGEWSGDRCGVANLIKFDKGPFLEL